MERGVRQGCPFSPILFNICIEPLLRHLLNHHKSDGYKIRDLTFNVQAFADDVVLISHTPEQMRNMISSVEEFCSVSGMKLTGPKCKWFSYVIRNGRRVASSESLKINGDEIKSINISDCLKYLGAPIAANKNAKIKFTEDLLIKIKHQVNQLLLSPLTFSQCLDAIKRLVLPQLDFICMNGVVSMDDMKKLDESLRGLIQKKIKCPGLPVEVVHAHWKDGGMNIPRLVDRLELLQIRNYIGLLLSKDECVRKLMHYNLKEEMMSRRIERVDDNNSDSFFGFRKDVANDYTKKTNNAFVRALNAAHKMKISINFSDSHNDDESFSEINDLSLKVNDLQLYNLNVDETKIVNVKSFLPTMNKLLEGRYCAALSSKEFRCHSFISLKNSKLSNFFIGNYKAPTSDTLVKFAFQARTNSLLTEEVGFKRNLKNDDKCRACGGHTTGSLMHHLNKCNAAMPRITARHNEIARVIADGIRDMWKFNTPPMNENSHVFINNDSLLPERSRNFKPDIWFYRTNARTSKKSFTIIEITCPYGMMTDTNTGRESSLDVRRKEKEKKYAPLIEDIKSTWNADAELHVIVVSSLGAIPKETLNTLINIFGTKKRASLIAKRCVVAALRGSWAIFFGKNLLSSHRNDSIPNLSDNNDLSTSDSCLLTDEEDGDILNK